MPNRRQVLMITGAAVAAAAAWPVTARSTEMDGTVTFEGGKAIPEGYLRIYLEDPAIDDEGLRRVAETRIESDGASTAIAFALSPPAGLDAASPLEVVVRLERADGWLLARGSTRVEADAPIEVTLNIVMY